MVLVENDTFFSELTKLFQSTRNSGSLSLTMKRYDGNDRPKPTSGKLPEPSEYRCLVRAKTNSKKLATIVNSKHVNKFQLAYCNLLRGNIDGLKKLKKSKAKPKATQ